MPIMISEAWNDPFNAIPWTDELAQNTAWVGKEITQAVALALQSPGLQTYSTYFCWRQDLELSGDLWVPDDKLGCDR